MNNELGFKRSLPHTNAGLAVVVASLTRRVSSLKKLFDHAEEAAERWENRYEMMHAERDEFYARLVKVARGEYLFDPTAPARAVQATNGAWLPPSSMTLAMARAEEGNRAIRANLEQVDYFATYRKVPMESDGSVNGIDTQ